MESTCVVSTGGDVLKGLDGILQNRDKLPKGVELVQDPGRMCVMLMVTGEDNFGDELYKCLDFGVTGGD